MTKVDDEINKLARRALEDCEGEVRIAHDAMIRANALLDKHHELTALARRMKGLAFIGVDLAAGADRTATVFRDKTGRIVGYD